MISDLKLFIILLLTVLLLYSKSSIGPCSPSCYWTLGMYGLLGLFIVGLLIGYWFGYTMKESSK